MQYYSLSHQYKVSFKEAVFQGISPDKSLYFPENIPLLPSSFWNNLENLTNEEIGFQLLSPFIGNEIPETILKEIIKKTLSFEFPLIQIKENVFSLELFHGPTLAFKDVGARFMAECLSYFNQNETKKSTVLVATSGDTGGAVANGFYKTPNVEVVILYPSQKVSEIQELQLTSLGHNITALEVEGTFDDCQAMVKQAFLDEELKSLNLTSANSINVARWLPQMIYFALAYKQLKDKNKEVVISCPSGNFGNICAGLLAKKMGLPITHFIAATNSNDTVTRFMETKNYQPKQTIPTISNAMDVSDPSNFVRILEMYNESYEALNNDFSSFSFTEEETKNAMKTLYATHNYIAEPHGAVGYLGLTKYMENKEVLGIFLETAHPIKFLETVEETLNITLELPNNIKEIMNKEKKSIKVKNYEEVKQSLGLEFLNTV
ncbi:MAG: threonine synthase [Limnohabitans sp.]|nr:threonine synthase [Limnohabitans sp.]